jgi:quercetin dioxygenase-like cupin family protein
LILGFIIVGCEVTAAGQVPMEQEPHHNLVFQNDALLVFEPRIAPGETTLEHSHTRDNASVCISGSTMTIRPHGSDWGAPGQPCKTGTVLTSDITGSMSSHTVHNAGTNVFQQVVVVNQKAGGWAKEGVIAAPATTLIKQTRSFQVYDVRLTESKRETTHLHKSPVVAVLISGKVDIGTQHLVQPGQWVLLPPGESHSLITIAEAKLIEIEVR